MQLQVAAAHVREQGLLREGEAKEWMRSGVGDQQRTAESRLKLRNHCLERMESGGGASEGEPANLPSEGQPQRLPHGIQQQQQQQQQQQLHSVPSNVTEGISSDLPNQNSAEQSFFNEAGMVIPIGLPVKGDRPQLEGAAAWVDHGNDVRGATAVDGLPASRQLPRSRSWSSGRDTWINRLSAQLEMRLQV